MRKKKSSAVFLAKSCGAVASLWKRGGVTREASARSGDAFFSFFLDNLHFSFFLDVGGFLPPATSPLPLPFSRFSSLAFSLLPPRPIPCLGCAPATSRSASVRASAAFASKNAFPFSLLLDFFFLLCNVANAFLRRRSRARQLNSASRLARAPAAQN
uniref:Putative transmembrane protein n=1 Tax=Toxoplasma gondii COUG TaxID=1074873 RepID=A0A2G8YDC3_TOXGO|nr:putative transmembrane protein [Toxoplasma gondii COUG]